MSIDAGDLPQIEHHRSVLKKAKVDSFGREYEFEYRVQNLNDFSPSIRAELAEDASVIGVTFGDGTVAWSQEVAHHRDLANQEEKKAIARFQSHGRFLTNLPEVKIHALEKDQAIEIAKFMNRSGVSSTTPIELNVVDDITMPEKIERIWRGRLGVLTQNRFNLGS